MELTEAMLEKLTKWELIHLLTGLIGEPELSKLWKQTRKVQAELGIDCLDCETIASKLNS